MYVGFRWGLVGLAITIKDVAKFAGVSVGTVSKVINKQGNVKDDIAVRVEAVIEKLNYRPSALARSIKKNKTNLIGLIVPRVMNSFYVQLIELIEKTMNGQNYTLLLGNTGEDIQTEVKYLRSFADMRVDGLLLTSVGRSDWGKIRQELLAFEALGIPVVLVVRDLENARCDTVSIDNELGSFVATQHLIENGHRRIGIISSSAQTSASQERINGYMNALSRHEIPIDLDLIKIGGTDLESGRQRTHEILDSENPPSALFVASNFQLLGAFRALKEKNLSIPEELSLVCFDDTEWGMFVDPPLTVIKPNIEKLCETSTRFLLDRIQKKYQGAPRHYRVKTTLVIRGSVNRA